MKLKRLIAAAAAALMTAVYVLSVPAEAAYVLSTMYSARMQLIASALSADTETAAAVKALGTAAVFISVSDGSAKAKVCTAQSADLNTAVNTAFAKARSSGLTPKWFRLDVAVTRETITYSRFISEYGGQWQDLMCSGISFDRNFKRALINEQIQSEGIFSRDTGKLDISRINPALTASGMSGITAVPNMLYMFETQGYFTENNSRVYKLISGNGSYNGRREIPVTKDGIESIAQKCGQQLAQTCDESGKFDYGCYPIDNEKITGYNILRHAGAVWSLINMYEMCGDETFVPAIDRALKYLDGTIRYKDKATAFVQSGSTLCLGGNGVALLAYCAYAEVFGSVKYTTAMTALANGILYMQQKDGSFVHTLDPKTYKTADKRVTIYYDGEAAYGLLKVYGLTLDKSYLGAAKKACDSFIKNKYGSEHSSWLAYAFNELTRYEPKEEYFEFGLKNVETDEYALAIYNTKAGLNTASETVNAAYEMYLRLINGGYKCAYLEQFHEKYLGMAVSKCAEYGLNSFMFPEYAMYLSSPKDAVYRFAVREDAMRIRIDDIQHFMNGYYLFWRNS